MLKAVVCCGVSIPIPRAFGVCRIDAKHEQSEREGRKGGEVGGREGRRRRKEEKEGVKRKEKYKGRTR